jgi:hypothetical protein
VGTDTEIKVINDVDVGIGDGVNVSVGVNVIVGGSDVIVKVGVAVGIFSFGSTGTALCVKPAITVSAAAVLIAFESCRLIGNPHAKFVTINKITNN